MGLLDFGAKVITTYRANVDEHVRQLEKLSGEERKRAQASIDANKATSASLKDLGVGLDNLSKSFGVAAQAGQFLWDSFKEGAEHSRLATAAGTADINRLRQASHGLVTEMNLLRDAALFQSAGFKLNQEQMELAEKAMLALNRRGFEAEKVHEAVTKAIVGLKTDGLDDLGIHLDKAGLSIDDAKDRAELFHRVMLKLAEVGGQVKDGQDTAADGVTKAAVSFQDSISKMKQSLGELVIALNPLLEKLASAVSLIAKIPGGASDAGHTAGRWINRNLTGPTINPGGIDPFSDDAYQQYRLNGGTMNEEQFLGSQLLNKANRGVIAQSQLQAEIGPASVSPAYKGKAERDADIAKAKEEAKAAAEKAAAKMKDDLHVFVERSKIDLMAWLKEKYTDAMYPASSEFARLNPNLDPELMKSIRDEMEVQAASERLNQAGTFKLPPGLGTLDSGVSAGLAKFNKPGGELSRRSGQTFLEGIFGKPEEFNLYAKAFDTLKGSFQSAFAAMIDGHESAGKAFKKFAAEGLKGIAVLMLGEAIKFGAYAVGSLVPGPNFNPAAAAGYAITAAKFLAGAAAVGVLAHEVGGGGGGGGVGGGGGAAPVGPPDYSSNNKQYDGTHRIVLIGDALGDNTARQQAATIKRRIEQAYGSSAGVHE